jgi:hypothetical protein
MAVGHKFAKETPKDVRKWEFGGTILSSVPASLTNVDSRRAQARA